MKWLGLCWEVLNRFYDFMLVRCVMLCSIFSLLMDDNVDVGIKCY